MFRDPVDPTKVDIIANYIGLESPAGGPLFGNFADDVEYRIVINNTGGASDDIVYKFRFKTTINAALPIYNSGPIAKPNDSSQVVQTTYTIERDDATGKHLVAADVPVAPANAGPRTYPSGSSGTGNGERDAYEVVAKKAVTSLPG